MVEGELAGKAAQAHALLAELAAAVTTDVTGTLAALVLPDVLGAVRQGELATCLLVERVDRTGEYSVDGAGSTTSYLRNVAGESDRWASERVLAGRALVDLMPTTASAWRDGDIGLGQATIIRKAVSRLERDLAGEIEKALADAAPHISIPQLADLAEVVIAAAAPDDAEAAAKKHRDNQSLSISKTFDGRYRLDGWFDCETGAEIKAAIEAFTRRKDPNLSILDDPIGRRRAEALRQLARHGMTHADSCNGNASPRHSLIVTISFEALMTSLGSADIHGHGPITAGAARRLACDHQIIPTVLGTQSDVLDIGVPNRLATPKQRFHLALRDGGCLFPGCELPASYCIAHHRVHWLNGGPTETCNLDSFCSFHHHQVHEGGWTYTTIDTNTLEFHPPSGSPPLRSRRRNPLNHNLTQRLNPQPTRIPKPRRT